MFSKKYCGSCKTEVGMLSNRAQVCIVGKCQICATCGVKSGSLMGDYACRPHLGELQQKLRIGNVIFCRKCQKFGDLKFVLCAFDGAPVCTDCDQRLGCAEGHVWCGVCQYQSWTASVTTLVLSHPIDDHARPVRGPQGEVVRYHQYREARMGNVMILRCVKDNPAMVRSVLLSKTDVARLYGQGGDIRPPPNMVVTTHGNAIMMSAAQAAGALGLDPADVIQAVAGQLRPYGGGSPDAFLTTAMASATANPQAMGSIVLAQSDVLTQQFLAHLRSLGTARESEVGAVPPWNQLSTLPAHVVKPKPTLAAIWVWVRGRALHAPHDAKRALAELQMQAPFFVGLASAVDAMIAYDGQKVLASLRQIRSDPTIDPGIVNVVGARVEVEAREVKDLTPATTNVTIGSVQYGDTVSGTKVGTQTTTTTSVDNRQFVDQSQHVDSRHIGDNIAGSKIGSQVQVQDSVVSGANLGGGAAGGAPAGVVDAGAALGAGAAQPAAGGAGPKFCPECGHKLVGPVKFCPECGKKF